MAVANSPSFLNKPGPLTRAYSDAKREIIMRLELQEAKILTNRLKLKEDFPLPDKLLAVTRSNKNLVLEITPLTQKFSTGTFGKRGKPIDEVK